MADPHPAKSTSGGPPGQRLGDIPVPLTELPDGVAVRVRERATHPDARLSIGRYIIVGEIGRGGMGLVYECWDPRIERHVAVKTIEPDLVPDPQEREEVIERFMRETKIVGRLHHPGIVTIFDYGQDPELRRGDDPFEPGRTYFYVMEYLDGQPLAQMMRERGVIPDIEAVSIAVDVAEALQIAHDQGVIHRDIKPSNIFIRENGQAVLLDFGIAKTSSPGLTRQGQILGTPSYLAPERLREKEVPLDGRADLFSLGVLLYTMLTGEAPFVGDNVYDLIDNIQKKEHPELKRATDGGRILSQALDRMLAKDPGARFATAAQAARKLRQIVRHLEGAQPDVADLDAHLVPLREEMADAATELASPEPIRVGDVRLAPRDGTRPEVLLNRRTRPIKLGEPEAYEASYPSPKVFSAEDLQELDEADVELLDGGADTNDIDGTPTLDRESTQVDRIIPEPAPEPVALEVDAGPAPIRRFGSVSEDETIAEPQGLGDMHGVLPTAEISPGRFESRTVADGQPSESKARKKRPRIRASLVDEADVIVKPAPLDDLHPDEMPTQSGVPTIPDPPAVAKPYDPIETDIVRPRRIPRDPAERAAEDRTRRATTPARSRPPASAAVARRTFGVRKSDGAAANGGGAEPFADIHVSGDLDRADRSRVVRNRVAILVGASLFAVAIGLLVGKLKQQQSSTPPTTTPTRQAPRARIAGPGTGGATTPELVTPRPPSAILDDAKTALASGDLVKADRLFTRATEGAPPGSDVHVAALLGRATTLRQAGVTGQANDLYVEILEHQTSGPAADEARAALGQGKRAPRSAPKPQPKAPASIQDECKRLAAAHLKDPTEGVRAFESLARAHPRQWCAHRNLGFFYRRVGDDKNAVSALKAYLRVRPGAPDRKAIEDKIAALSKKLGT